MSQELTEHDLTTEAWREYDFIYDHDTARVYRIDNPVKLFARPGGTTHRVLDADGVVHCLPAPGEKWCVVRWQSKDLNKPVNF